MFTESSRAKDAHDAGPQPGVPALRLPTLEECKLFAYGTGVVLVMAIATPIIWLISWRPNPSSNGQHTQH